jgi:hypothetical protein
MLFTRVTLHVKSKGLPIGGPLLSKKIIFFTCIAPHTKSKGLSIGGPLLNKKLCFLHAWHRVQKVRGSRSAVPYSTKIMFFTRVAPRTKSKGLLIGGSLFSKKTIITKKTYAFYMRSTADIKQGVPDRRSTSSITFRTLFATYKKQGAP